MNFRQFFIFLWLLLAGASLTLAQGTAFTYQGRLNDGGSPGSGNYDLTFSLYDTISGGSQVGVTFTNLNTVVTNGLFTATPDFGTNFPGASRWLEIAVRTNGGAVFSTLAPRQPITPTPYAITASSLSGTLPAAQLGGNYPSTVIFTNPANSFAGNGTGLTNVNAATVNGLTATNFWQSAGNSGTSPAYGNFLGTKDNQPLELKVNGLRALRLEPNANGVPNLIGGAASNMATNGTGITIGGGSGNTVSGTNSTVPGGNSNSAFGSYSFAAGNRAKATNQGAFVWADSQAADFSSTSNDQFNIRAAGGVRIVTGQTNMTLDGVPVLVGSGVGVLAWQTIGGTALAAQMHYGYVLTNSQLVMVTLPASANIGDVFRVSGAGKGGWKIVQNANQSILARNFTLISSNSALTWTASGMGSMNWVSLAASADGNRLVGAVRNSTTVSSGDFGGTTTGGNISANWTNITASVDGSKLWAAAAGASGQIYFSVNSGVSWSSAGLGVANWTAVATSADGGKYAASVYGGQIYTSAGSSGITGFWVSLASSADGSRLVAGQYLGAIFYSVNGGTSWTATTTPNNFWRSIAASADGSRYVAVSSPGPIFVSADAGATWTETSAPNTNNWSAVASSDDGRYLIAAAQSGSLYVSADYGTSWSVTGPGNANWTAVVSSADGSKLAAAIGNGNIYICQPSAQLTTTSGMTGYLLGGQNSAVELQYIGNNQFIPISHEGTVFAY